MRFQGDGGKTLIALSLRSPAVFLRRLSSAPDFLGVVLCSTAVVLVSYNAMLEFWGNWVIIMDYRWLSSQRLIRCSRLDLHAGPADTCVFLLLYITCIIFIQEWVTSKSCNTLFKWNRLPLSWAAQQQVRDTTESLTYLLDTFAMLDLACKKGTRGCRTGEVHGCPRPTQSYTPRNITPSGDEQTEERKGP